MVSYLFFLICIFYFLSFLLDHSSSAPHPLWGDILVVAAQLIAAAQMVIEEKFIGKFDVSVLLSYITFKYSLTHSLTISYAQVAPLRVVGNEGVWGACVTFSILFVLYWIPRMQFFCFFFLISYQLTLLSSCKKA